MISSGNGRPAWRALLLAAVLALFPALAYAQTGTVKGTVSGPNGSAVAAAQVGIAGTRIATTTNELGQFTLTGVAEGLHRLRVTKPGFVASYSDVTVRPGEEALVAVKLEETNVQLDAMVVSASRKAERRSEAPATVTRIDANALSATPGNTFVGALKQANGLDFVQVGMTSVAVNARGFNSSFNNRMLMLEDGRIDVLPENGLPVGGFTPIPKIDLAGVEVIVGPGSALYGADASNGVLTLQSKDARDYPGGSFEVTGGNRQYVDLQGRYAVASSQWGFKVAGEYNRFNDWSNRIHATAASTSPLESSVGNPNGLDWNSGVVRGYGAVSRYIGSAEIQLNAGYSRTDGVGQTNVGRNELVGWTYNVQQLRATTPHWYVSAYRTESNAGKSYAANRYTTFRPLYDTTKVSDDSIRKMSDWPSDGQLYAAEVQNNFKVPALLNTEVTWGAQYRHDVVSSDRQWLTDRLTGKDLQISHEGAYAQTETPLTRQLRILLAARYDHQDNYDPQFSPKVGFLFSPVQGQTFRLFYNRAFKSPTALQTDFYIPNFLPAIGVFGDRNGFTVKDASGNVVRTYAPIAPEQNQTLEAGYKGLIHGRLFLDVAAYASWYKNFMSPLVIIANPYGANGTATVAYDANGHPVTDEAGHPQIVLTYFNLGQAFVYGTDASLTYSLNPKVDFTATGSLQKLDHVSGINTNLASDKEATAFNSPEDKFTLGVHARDLGRWSGGATYRYVHGYHFVSGINVGNIPTFSTLDLNAGYRVPALHSQLTLAVANLFTCHGNDVTMPDSGAQCGFGVKHTEMINMPGIGTMVFLGVRVDTK